MSHSTPFRREVSAFRPGDHLCCIYGTDEEHRALLTPFLRQGLERNEKVVYIVAARTKETLLRYLREDGLDPRPFLDRGQLVILTSSEAGMRDGTSIPDRMRSFLRRETERAIGEGYGALRVTGEMSWVLRRLPGPNRLFEYESSTFLPGSRCLALCQYDKRRFPPEVLLEALATHPIAVIGTEVYENFQYVPPEALLTHDFPTALLANWIEGLRIRKRVKAGEEALRRSEQKFRATFENSMDGIMLTVPDGGILAANPAACEMLGRTEEEVCESGRDGLVDLSDPRLSGLLEERARTGMCHGEIVFVRKDGTKFPVEISSRIFKDLSGNPRTSLIFRDFSERKKQERLLKESEAQFRVIFEGSKEGILLADVESGRFITGNPAACAILQYTQDEIRQLKVEDILPRGVLPGILEGVEQQANGEVESAEGIPLRRKDVSILHVDLLANRVSVAGRECLLASFRDVTGLLSLEKRLRAVRMMEAVGTLAGGIAHEFNNALTGILGFGELLRMRVAGDEQALHDLDEIFLCAERAATLTRQLLTFARRQVIAPVHLDLSALVADLKGLIVKAVGEQIEVTTSLGKNVPAINADREQIEQVVMNLCLNARDAMPEGGRLAVETKDVYLDEECVRRNPYMMKGRYCLLAVSDTGIGMDEKTSERVFEPFFTTKGPDRGTGLGLAMVYGIVKQHNGFINLASEPGKGTVLKAYFPAIDAPPDVAPALRWEETVRGGTETILLAEDEESIRSFMEQALKGLGYTVLVARNGEEAVEIFDRNQEIALAVLDVVMPRKGGKKAFEEMHNRDPRLKVIFMSGYSADAIHLSFVLTTGVPFLQKPFGPTILARKVREVLDTL